MTRTAAREIAIHCAYSLGFSRQSAEELLQERLDRGDLGYKTGVGVYDWRQRDMDDFRRRVSAPYLKTFNWKLPED